LKQQKISGLGVKKMAKRTRTKQQKETLHKLRQMERLKMLEQGIRPVKNRTITTSSGPMPTVGQYEDTLNSSDFEESLRELYSLDLKHAHDDTIRSALFKVISYNTNPGVRVIQMTKPFRTLNTNHLFRVRKCYGKSSDTMKIQDDAWNPKPEYCRRGRLNNEGESVLYVTELPETAIKETKVGENDCFWLIVYNVNASIPVVNIGGLTPENSDFAVVHNKVADFLRVEFKRDVRPGEEYEYRVSKIIGDFFYSYKNEFDGWSYPSAVSSEQFSLCLEPLKAREKLSVAFALHCEIQEGKVACDTVAFLNENGTFDYEPIEEALKRVEIRTLYNMFN
jgi:hypothetical protein